MMVDWMVRPWVDYLVDYWVENLAVLKELMMVEK